jgi:hypothetical protein
MLRVPAVIWKRNVRMDARRVSARLEFMGPDHHRIRNFVVSELGRLQEPLSPGTIAAAVGIESDRVRNILDDLEAHMTFLYRRDGTNVDWAYPVTAEETPHRVAFDNGERFFGA